MSVVHLFPSATDLQTSRCQIKNQKVELFLLQSGRLEEESRSPICALGMPKTYPKSCTTSRWKSR